MTEIMAICYCTAIVMLAFAGLAYMADTPSAENREPDDDDH